MRAPRPLVTVKKVTETGMHWQSMKGGRAHHFEAERMNQPLPAAVVLGGDPILMLAAILPLPEDMDELAFAGFLRGRPTQLVRATSLGIPVPANFPVFRVQAVTRRAHPIYPATVVGKPPQEDKFMGVAAGEMIGPLIRMINPNIVDLCAFENASF